MEMKYWYVLMGNGTYYTISGHHNYETAKAIAESNCPDYKSLANFLAIPLEWNGELGV